MFKLSSPRTCSTRCLPVKVVSCLQGVLQPAVAVSCDLRSLANACLDLWFGRPDTRRVLRHSNRHIGCSYRSKLSLETFQTAWAGDALQPRALSSARASNCRLDLQLQGYSRACSLNDQQAWHERGFGQLPRAGELIDC